MTENIERALETQTPYKIQYAPVDQDYAYPVISSPRAVEETGLGRKFETHHPDYGECTVEITERYHSESTFRRLIKEELTIFDWMKAKLWRLKRRIT